MLPEVPVVKPSTAGFHYSENVIFIYLQREAVFIAFENKNKVPFVATQDMDFCINLRIYNEEGCYLAHVDHFTMIEPEKILALFKNKNLTMELVGGGVVEDEDQRLAQETVINRIIGPLFDYLKDKKEVKLNIARTCLFQKNLCDLSDVEKMGNIFSAIEEDDREGYSSVAKAGQKMYVEKKTYLKRFGINLVSGQYFYLHILFRPRNTVDLLAVRQLRYLTGDKNPFLHLVYDSRLDLKSQQKIQFLNQEEMQLISNQYHQGNVNDAINSIIKMFICDKNLAEHLKTIKEEDPEKIKQIGQGLYYYRSTLETEESFFSSLYDYDPIAEAENSVKRNAASMLSSSISKVFQEVDFSLEEANEPSQNNCNNAQQ